MNALQPHFRAQVLQ